MRLMHTFTRAYYRNESETVQSHLTLMNLQARLGLAWLDPGSWVWRRRWDMGGTLLPAHTSPCTIRATIPTAHCPPWGCPKLPFYPEADAMAVL